MKIAVFGSGYVGLVSGACFAELGHHVTGIDVNAERVALLNQGKVDIYEPGLQNLVQKNIENAHLQFTQDVARVLPEVEIIFIAVGTPPQSDGSVDLSYIDQVATTVGQNLLGYKLIVNKSTVPVGTAERVKAIIQGELDLRGVQTHFDVISNPEFLKEGRAVNDFMKPDRIIIGTNSTKALALMTALYAPFNRSHDRIIAMDTRSAELTKYAANAMLATKISFMNEMSQIAEKVGADIEQVRLGIGSDQRIGYHFIYPGCGYGGSCFPKDVNGLIHTAEKYNYDTAILKAVHQVNEQQKKVLYEKVARYFKGQLQGKKIALWGLSFKPNTDDIREAPSCVLMEALWKAKVVVQAYDPEAMQNIAKHYGSRKKNLRLCKDKEQALIGADILIIMTEWSEFRNPDFIFIKETLKSPTIFDGRNLFDPVLVKRHGLNYYSIGR